MSAYSIPTFTASGSTSSQSSSRNAGTLRDPCRYAPIGPVNRNRIAYFYDDEVAGIHYGKSHPMKPQRMALTNELIMHYGLHERMEIYEPRWATEEEIKQFHVADYVDFLRQVTPENKSAFKEHIERFNVGEDCPIFHDLYKFCRISAGGSIEAASRINTGFSDIAINWSGGLHHAKKVSASGFCYVNDIVLSILELLRYHQRVVYIDIDVHHGDGVQEAFYNTNRVMTVSFHRYGSSAEGPDFFFPGTGGLHETGVGAGQYYSVNVPLKAGMDDNTYVALFQSVMDKVMLSYRPGAVVLQCGADSLGCDRIGCFCLSIKGHGRCVEYMKRYNVPMVVLGGGGYTVRNVARCWAYETAILVNATLPNAIPEHEFKHYYAPDFSLFPKIDNQLRNENTPHDLSNIRYSIFEALRHIEHAPSVQATEIPPPLSITSTDESIAAYRDRETQRIADLSIREREAVMSNARFYENDYYGDIQDQDRNGEYFDAVVAQNFMHPPHDAELANLAPGENAKADMDPAASSKQQLPRVKDITDVDEPALNAAAAKNNGDSSTTTTTAASGGLYSNGKSHSAYPCEGAVQPPPSPPPPPSQPQPMANPGHGQSLNLFEAKSLAVEMNEDSPDLNIGEINHPHQRERVEQQGNESGKDASVDHSARSVAREAIPHQTHVGEEQSSRASHDANGVKDSEDPQPILAEPHDAPTNISYLPPQQAPLPATSSLPEKNDEAMH